LIAFGIRQVVDGIGFFRGRGFDLFFYKKQIKSPPSKKTYLRAIVINRQINTHKQIICIFTKKKKKAGNCSKIMASLSLLRKVNFGAICQIFRI